MATQLPAAPARPLPAPGAQAADERMLVVFVHTAAALALLYPLAGLALSAFLLLHLPAHTAPVQRRVLAFVLAFSLAMLAGARPLNPDESNDIDGYYLVYEDLLNGDLSALTHFGGGLEVGITGLFWLWAVLLPQLTPNGLMFCLALTSALLFAAWVETSFYGDREPPPPALIGLCLLMLNLYFSTQLVRQFLSLVLLLFAITAAGRLRALVWVALATSVHITAIPFYLLYLLARRGWAGVALIVGLAWVVRTYFAELLVAFEILPETVAGKLVYYQDNEEQDTSTDLASLRMIGLLGVIAAFLFLLARGRPAPACRPWLALPWATAAVHLLLLPVPLASLRTTLVVHSLLPGLIAYRMFSAEQRMARQTVISLLFAYKLVTVASGAGAASLWGTVTMLHGFGR